LLTFPACISSFQHGPDSRNANLYAVDIPSSASLSSEETVTLTEVYVHAAVPKPPTLPQDAQNQGLYWQGDLLAGAAAALTQQLPAEAVKIRVKWVFWLADVQLVDGKLLLIAVDFCRRAPSPRAGSELVPDGWSLSRPTGSSVFTFSNTAQIPPSHTAEAAVLYEQPEPVMTIRKLERTAQVSHWGHSVAVHDDIQLVNDGPKFVPSRQTT
jgi:oligosaccharyltransferase complex subunit alpha (ribophorin I)